MCKKWFEQHPGKIPTLLMNVLLIVSILVDIGLILKGGYPSDIKVALIYLLGILIGTLAVGNSITYLRSKTVQNELIRSNIDIINHCITNKKLKIETYSAVLNTNYNAASLSQKLKEAEKGAESSKKQNNEETKRRMLNDDETKMASDEANKALKKYNEYYEELRKICNNKNGDIVDMTFENALEGLKKQICPGKKE